MKALVTGGGGFLGTRIALMLRDRGADVTVLGRSRYPHLENAAVRTIAADIRDGDAVRAACMGMDVVFHAAAMPGMFGPRRLFHEINVDGTHRVIEACRRCGVGKLVYTSSPSVVFGTGELCGVDESQPYPDRYLAHYPATKAIAEQAVLRANDANLSTVALRPHLILGPGDPHLIPRIVARARTGKLRQVGDGKNLVDITYIDDAASAHILAADHLSPTDACAGHAYFISQGEPVVLWDFLSRILKGLDLPPPRRRVSQGAAHAVGSVLETAYRLFAPNPGSLPELT